jgi:nucleotide-binding universal stress UspA family protein
VIDGQVLHMPPAAIGATRPVDVGEGGDRVGAHRARSVRVFAPDTGARRCALRWAARHAARTEGSVQVLVDSAEHGDRPAPPGNVLALLARTVHDLAERVLGVVRPPTADPLVRDLVRAVAGARLLVVPQSLPQLPAIVELLTEPLVVVPDRVLPPADAPVVLALAPSTGPEVIGAAFEAAAQYRVPLQVEHAADPDREVEAAVQSCEDDLAAWRLARPEVAVDVEVVDAEPAEALRRRARGAQLVVVGRPTRGRAREVLAPSPTSELTCTAGCPVLVVPPSGPSRPTWSPRSGWGHTH